MCHLSELPHPQYFIYWHPNWPWSLLKKTSLKLISAYYLEIKKKSTVCGKLRGGLKLLAFWVIASVDKLFVKDLHKILRRYFSL